MRNRARALASPPALKTNLEKNAICKRERARGYRASVSCVSGLVYDLPRARVRALCGVFTAECKMDDSFAKHHRCAAYDVARLSFARVSSRVCTRARAVVPTVRFFTEL